jgi:hypothetical protein
LYISVVGDGDGLVVVVVVVDGVWNCCEPGGGIAE